MGAEELHLDARGSLVVPRKNGHSNTHSSTRGHLTRKARKRRGKRKQQVKDTRT